MKSPLCLIEKLADGQLSLVLLELGCWPFVSINNIILLIGWVLPRYEGFAWYNIDLNNVETNFFFHYPYSIGIKICEIFTLYTQHVSRKCDSKPTLEKYISKTIRVRMFENIYIFVCLFTISLFSLSLVPLWSIHTIQKKYDYEYDRCSFCIYICILHAWGLQFNELLELVTLFRSITMLCVTDIIVQKYSLHLAWMWEYFIKYCRSHITLLSIWVMLCFFSKTIMYIFLCPMSIVRVYLPLWPKRRHCR